MNQLRTRDGQVPPTRSSDDVDADPLSKPASGSSICSENTSLSHREWIASMVDKYEGDLLAYASRLLGGDPTRAQDAVQETFLRLCRERRESIESRVAAWLFSVCRTRVIDMQRAAGHSVQTLDQIPIADPQPNASQLVEAAEQRSRLAMLVERLTPRQQEVIRLRLQADLSYREISEITGLTVSNVGFHLHAAVCALREAMQGT